MKKYLILLTLISLTACKSNKFTSPMKLGGKWVSAEKLNHGYDIYMNNCMSCHGVLGDGKGPAHQGQYPQPRNFKDGNFKFANVAGGELPRDEDLKRTIRFGLTGTGMLPWDLQDNDLDSVVQYIKTFSPVWQTQKEGTPVAKSSDPFGAAKSAEAIELGKKVYHGVAQCYSCHASYAPLSEISAWSKELTGNAVTELRESSDLPLNQDSSYGHKYMPPDFTRNFIKTGGEIERIYDVLNVGINGTSMPAWKGVLGGDENESERRQWALAYYIHSLYQLKFDDAARKEFFSKLSAR